MGIATGAAYTSPRTRPHCHARCPMADALPPPLPQTLLRGETGPHTTPTLSTAPHPHVSFTHSSPRAHAVAPSSPHAATPGAVGCVRSREGRRRPRCVVRAWSNFQIHRVNRPDIAVITATAAALRGPRGRSRAPCPGTLSSCARRGKPRRHGPPPPCSSPNRSAPRHPRGFSPPILPSSSRRVCGEPCVAAAGGPSEH